MSPDPLSQYEQLTPEEAAEVDSVCLRFERAWKETRAGGPVPRLASYLDDSHGAARAVLFEELVALERDCRQRYGHVDRTEDSREVDAGADDLTHVAGPSPCRRADLRLGRPAGWPSIPGLELLEVLGSGGMGLVFKARQATLDRDVAVKLLHDDHRADPGRRERFLQEARAVARLRHPHLVQVYEFGEVPAAGGATSQPYLVLEYVAGGSLADLLRGAPQPPAEAARLIEMLADAIHYAHQQGVIHRDLKPANILLDARAARDDSGLKDPAVSARAPPLESDGRQSRIENCIPKITDFGLAKILAGSDLTKTGEFLGTPSYMAPEQAASKSVPITPAVDVYGLGAILYEILTGRPPFAAATLEATVLLMRLEEPVSPRRLQPAVPRDLETICLRCLRKEPGHRYASALDLADDLRRFQAGQPIRARPVGTGERLVAWCRRKPAIAALLGMILVFLAGSIGLLWQLQRASHNAARAKREQDTARQEKERADRRLEMVRDQVGRLNQLGGRLFRQPGQHRAGQAVLEQALDFCQKMLPEDANDPRVRQESARLFKQLADIYNTLGQADKAAEAFGRRAILLKSLLKDKPTSKVLRLDLADTLRWRAHELRFLGKTAGAREAYDEAARLHEGLLGESPNNAHYQVALANTLLNSTTLLSSRDEAEELERLFRRIIALDRAAVSAAPNNIEYKTELALVLEDQGLFFLNTGKASQAEAPVREALAIHQSLLTAGQPGFIERYLARSFVALGRVLAATGQAEEAEKSYRRAVELLDRRVEDFPESMLRRADLAQALTRLASLLKDPGRQREAEEIRRQVIRRYESLKADFPEDPRCRRNLVESCVALGMQLFELGRASEAGDLYRKAHGVDPEDPVANNNLAWFLTNHPEPGLRNAARAVQLAKKAVDAQRKSGLNWNTLGAAHYRNGDHKAAIAELETAARLREGGGESWDWFFLAMAHWRLGDFNEARTYFDRGQQWMDKHQPRNEELRRLRAEAKATLAEARKH
jgi:serine/threonine-protein kinase